MIYWRIFWEFFKVGLFTFGGGYAMIPLIQRAAVERFHWITMEEFAEVLVISELTPGPFAINSATLIGYKMAHFLGALVGTAGVVLPSFLVILVIASIFPQIQHNPVVQAAFKGLKPAVLGLIVVAALSIGKVALTGIRSAVVTLLVVCGVYFFKVHPVLALIVAGVAGALLFR